jgi:thiosulfate/3-mercaptopyruvate sulfurtransferase
MKSKISSGKVVLVDTRIPEEHFGQEKVSHIKRFGHLPGSRLWPAKYMTNAGVDFAPSFLKDVEELKQMAMGVGIPADKNVEIITYSNQGTSAAMGYFVLHDILGYKNVRIFDGSLLEYAPEKDLPMETNSWGYRAM